MLPLPDISRKVPSFPNEVLKALTSIRLGTFKCQAPLGLLALVIFSRIL